MNDLCNNLSGDDIDDFRNYVVKRSRTFSNEREMEEIAQKEINERKMEKVAQEPIHKNQIKEMGEGNEIITIFLYNVYIILNT
jgi:hypothetical protein